MLLRTVDRVEGVEELFLDLLLADEELDVVHQQNVRLAVALLEHVLPAVTDRVDEVVGELFGRDVLDLETRLHVERVVPDRMKQVCFAKAGLAVDEQWVVRIGRRLGDGERGGTREAVRATCHECGKRVAGVEVVIADDRGKGLIVLGHVEVALDLQSPVRLEF